MEISFKFKGKGYKARSNRFGTYVQVFDSQGVKVAEGAALKVINQSNDDVGMLKRSAINVISGNNLNRKLF